MLYDCQRILTIDMKALFANGLALIFFTIAAVGVQAAGIPAKELTWPDRVNSDGGQMSEKTTATTYSSEARRSIKIPHIGVLTVARNNPLLGAFRQGLRDLGYMEGQNIAIEHRGADGNEDRLPALAAELLRMNVDLIVATSPRGARAVQGLSNTIPIVLTGIPGPGLGLVKNLNQPAGNVTGSSFMSPELGGKRLELLKQTIPKTSSVAVLANIRNLDREKSIKEIESVARSLRVRLHILNVKTPDEIENAFSSMAKKRVGALTVLTQAMFVLNRARIVELAAKHRLPTMYPRSEFVEQGGLVSYGSDHRAEYRRAAYYVDRILKGAKPADLPLEQPTKFELVINLRTAKQLSLTIPPKVLTWADKVIE